MKKYMDMIVPAIGMSILVIIFALVIGGKVYAENAEAAERAQRETKESEYVTCIRQELQENGFCNSGVNMTKETNEAGEWEYTVTVYHRSFLWMDDAERANFEKQLEDVGKDTLGKISLELCVR
ncbi:MAG: hypothetical protein IJ397_03615 [Lachnospiraceae bacterium]|nr:hypothetical protein [Lachnospiraceae bacterium]